jgi:hypothetical protein
MYRAAHTMLAAGLAGALALVVLAAPAAAGPAATLRAKLQPNELGADAAVSLGFHLGAGAGGEPAPLSGFSLRLPPGMGFAASELGLATCSAASLLARGAAACPRESLIGGGAAQIRVPFGARAVREAARVSIFMARPARGHTTALFYFDGRMPVIAPLVLRSEVLTPEGSRASILSTPVPAIATAPEGPEAALVALRATIGPRSLRYRKRVDGRLVAYRPRGIGIPARCPAAGFVFAARFRFRDGSEAGAKDVVRCPASNSGRGTGGRGR